MDPTSIWSWIPGLALLMVILIVAYVVYSGLFTSINVDTKEPAFGDLVVAYKTGQGNYRLIIILGKLI